MSKKNLQVEIRKVKRLNKLPDKDLPNGRKLVNGFLSMVDLEVYNLESNMGEEHLLLVFCYTEETTGKFLRSFSNLTTFCDDNTLLTNNVRQTENVSGVVLSNIFYHNGVELKINKHGDYYFVIDNKYSRI